MPASRLLIAEDRYVVEAESGRDEGFLRFDPAAAPAAVDFVGTEGPSAGRTIPALYRIRGNLLQLCYCMGEGTAPQPRPTTWDTGPGSPQILVRYRRVQGGMQRES